MGRAVVRLCRRVVHASCTGTPATDSKRIVVLVSIDGLAAFYVDDPVRRMPTIRASAKEGVWGHMKASAPTVTWPNHTTLVTGVTPARHGVVGNNYFDRQRGAAGAISDPDLDKDQIVKTPTIYDVAKSSGLKTAAIRWPATRNAHARLDVSRRRVRRVAAPIHDAIAVGRVPGRRHLVGWRNG